MKKHGTTPSRDEVSNLSLFHGLSSENFSRLLAIAEGRRYPAGRTILHEGSAPMGVFVLVEGSVKVLKALSPDEAKTLTVLGPGESFGEMSVFEGKPHVASVVALEPATVLILPADRLLELIQAEPHLGVHVLSGLLQTCCARLRELDEQVTTLSRWWMGHRRHARDGSRHEQRQFPRARIPVRVQCSFLSGRHVGPPMLGLTRDLSAGGLAIEIQSVSATETRLPPEGSHVLVQFSLPRRSKVFAIHSQVAWTRSTPPAGIGVEFLRLSDDDRTLIAEFVERSNRS
ncbi:MAG: cyclic nucleotide-binding domain-containing protein [Deltaproteobacteria bacterium]|nr:cyclic nucleotide-binding domain-containing protein [Deltaproteobacteria bacterium]